MAKTRCHCLARLEYCQPSQSRDLCPASTYRLQNDLENAMREIFEAETRQFDPTTQVQD